MPDIEPTLHSKEERLDRIYALLAEFERKVRRLPLSDQEIAWTVLPTRAATLLRMLQKNPGSLVSKIEEYRHG